MISKISPLLLRVLSPLKTMKRPRSELTPKGAEDGGEGGYSPPSYNTPENPSPEIPEGQSTQSEEGQDQTETPETPVTVPFQPGLTRVILDLHAQRTVPPPRRGYEPSTSGSQKDSTTKGSRLDKKAG